MCFKLLLCALKIINSVFLGKGRKVRCNGACTSAAQLSSAGRLLSVCLMIYQFYSNELALGKCII